MTNLKLIFDLLFILLRNMGVVVTFSYLLSRTRLFKSFFYSTLSRQEKFFLILFFGLLSITGTYLGIYIMDAYANMRAIWAVMAGFLGGPIVGILAGAIGGIHRLFLGGFTALACCIGTISSGLFGGIFHKAFKKQEINSLKAFYIGLAALTIEMIIIIIFSRPISLDLELISIIGIPMILTNAVGISIFVNILNNVKKETENIRAHQAKIVLDIANQTLSYLNKVNSYQEAVQEAARIILKMTEVAAVAITDREKILAYEGEGSDHHKPGQTFITKVTKEVIKTGELAIGTNKYKIGCPFKSCPLESVVVAPLKWDNQVMGVLKLYKVEGKLSQVDISLAIGIASLLSTQIQLARLSEQVQLKTKAELKALQAQINPHFLFNSLNTIASFVRTNPVQARDLLIKLSDFFRSTLGKGQNLIPLKKELDSVYNYFSIEKARFGDRIEIIVEIPEHLNNILMPNFTLQPLVENSVKHGILSKNESGYIKISAYTEKNNVILQVVDNGIGIPEDEIELVLKEGYGQGSGIGLSNVANRIKNLFGSEYGIKIESVVKQGTQIKIKIPAIYSREGVESNEISSFGS